MVSVMANVSKIGNLKGKYEFSSSKDFILYSNKIDRTRIGNINMNDLFVGFNNKNEKICGVTIDEIEKYMSFWFATGGINDFKKLDQIMPLPDKALEININQYIEKILSNKRKIDERNRTILISENIGKNAQAVSVDEKRTKAA